MAQNPTQGDIAEKRDDVAANLKELISSADELLRTTHRRGVWFAIRKVLVFRPYAKINRSTRAA